MTTTTETASTPVDTNDEPGTFRMVDYREKGWAVVVDYPSGLSAPVVEGVQQWVAQAVYDEAVRVDEGEVLIPAVTIPAGYRERTAELLAAIDVEALEKVAEAVYRELLPHGQTFSLLEGDAFMVAGKRSGWDDLWNALTDVASSFVVAAGIHGGELNWPAWMSQDEQEEADAKDTSPVQKSGFRNPPSVVAACRQATT